MTRRKRLPGGLAKVGAGAGAGLLVIGQVGVLTSHAGAVTTTRYVASTGSDGSDCSVQASPCLTIAHAISVANAGDVISPVDSHLPAMESVDVDKDLTLLLPFGATLPDDISIDAGKTLTVAEIADTTTLSGVISGAGGLTQDSPDNSLTLSGANTYSGPTTVVNGTLQAGAADALSSTSAVTVDAGGTLDLNSLAQEIPSLDGTGAVQLESADLTVDSTGFSPYRGTVSMTSGKVVLPNAPSLLMTGQPSDQAAAVGSPATFTAPEASDGTSTVGVQWQSSSNAGATWTDLSDGSGISGSATKTLSVTPGSTSQSSTEYRALFSLNGGAGGQATSNPASLLVWLGSGAPKTFAPPPGEPQAAGTYTLALSFVPGFGCDVRVGAVRPRCTGSSAQYRSGGVTYTVDASGLGFEVPPTVSGYLVNPSTFVPAAPAGNTYVVGFAVTWAPQAQQPLGPMTLTISDPAIQAGDTIYELINGQMQALPAAGDSAVVTAGQVVISFVNDPVFMMAQPNPPAVFTPPVNTGSSGPSGSQAGPKLIRLGGSDRIATAVTISQYELSQPGTAKAVVVGRDDLFADDLAGSPFAQYVGGPLLLTDPKYLDNRTATEIIRVLPAGGTVYVLGDTSALSAAVEQAISALGYHVVRVGGPDRWATAVDVADAMGDPATVFEADGTTPSGAVSAAPAAILTHGDILLTAGSSQASATAASLAAHAPTTRYALGNAAASADASATAIAGADEDATAAAVAQRFFPSPTVVGIATDGVFPDALTGASTSEAGNGPTFLVPTNGPLPAALVAYLRSHPTITTVIVYGGTAAVSDAVAQAAIQAVG